MAERYANVLRQQDWVAETLLVSSFAYLSSEEFLPETICSPNIDLANSVQFVPCDRSLDLFSFLKSDPAWNPSVSRSNYHHNNIRTGTDANIAKLKLELRRKRADIPDCRPLVHSAGDHEAHVAYWHCEGVMHGITLKDKSGGGY